MTVAPFPPAAPTVATAATDAAPAPRRRTVEVRHWLPAALVLAGLVALWQLVVSAARIAPTLVPGPWLVVSSTWDDRVDLWPAVVTTTEEAVAGLLVALAVAVALAISIDWSKTVRRSIYPLVVASQTIPVIVLAPMVVIWWGFGIGPKIGLVALFSFFPIAVGLVKGLESVDLEALNLLRTMRATRWQLLWRVKFPAALPQLFTGLQISVTYSFTSAIVAEWVGGQQGLGVYMTAASQAAPIRTDLVFGATVVTALLTVALFVLVAVVQRAVMPWQPPKGS